MLNRIMKRAHKIAKEKLEGDYQARMALALKIVWSHEKYSIAEWFIKKNSFETLKYRVLKVTHETEKAYQFNGVFWVPKSLVNQENKTEVEDQQQNDEFIEEEIDVEIKRNNSGRTFGGAAINGRSLVKPWGGVQDDNYLPSGVDTSDLKFEFKSKNKGGGFRGRLHGVVRYKSDLELAV